ncbi:MAG: hypothetical protein CL933_03780 [Deltaproteobacteria bacterium]|nr:hypothetical protein [Deltaproteobacteria bacterium]
MSSTDCRPGHCSSEALACDGTHRLLLSGQAGLGRDFLIRDSRLSRAHHLADVALETDDHERDLIHQGGETRRSEFHTKGMPSKSNGIFTLPGLTCC